MSGNMEELQWQVVTRCHCPWDTFIENVREAGWTMRRLSEAADECGDDERALRRLIAVFI